MTVIKPNHAFDILELWCSAGDDDRIIVSRFKDDNSEYLVTFVPRKEHFFGRIRQSIRYIFGYDTYPLRWQDMCLEKEQVREALFILRDDVAKGD